MSEHEGEEKEGCMKKTEVKVTNGIVDEERGWKWKTKGTGEDGNEQKMERLG